jgi:hypothetical protein
MGHGRHLGSVQTENNIVSVQDKLWITQKIRAILLHISNTLLSRILCSHLVMRVYHLKLDWGSEVTMSTMFRFSSQTRLYCTAVSCAAPELMRSNWNWFTDSKHLLWCFWMHNLKIWQLMVHPTRQCCKNFMTICHPAFMLLVSFSNIALPPTTLFITGWSTCMLCSLSGGSAEVTLCPHLQSETAWPNSYNIWSWRMV